MDFMELVNKRHSVRDYDARPVPREDINACLEAARLAPSACNSQPWQFIVVEDPGLKASLCRAMLSGIYSMNSFIDKAPCLVVVMTDSAKWFTKVCNVLRDTKMYLVDIGIACEHFALAAAERGIGTCLLGWFNERAVKKALDIPLTKRVHIIISMGYPAPGSAVREKNRKTLSEMSSYT
jgi:nitroreductase